VVRSTLNVTQIGTQTVENQSATIATATINLRLLPGDTPQDACDHIHLLMKDIRVDGEAAVHCKAEGQTKGDLTSPVDCWEFRTLQQTIHEVFPDVIVAAGLTSVSTDSSWYYGVTDKVYRFIPMRVKSEDMPRIHGINERIRVENMAEIVRFYAQLIRNAAS
jgi:carboxypeptidase PM20D1